ncbi:MAG: hypothetical protein CM1200mP26_00940 [Acidimicrobiales bacterium]|nr:MAG: hypothetical protein CM1200mP26_00940 [Acidimicrobiales bacterium]
MAVEHAHLVVVRVHPRLSACDMRRPVPEAPCLNPFHAATEGLGDGLMAKTHSEGGSPGGVEVAHQVEE